MLLNQFPRLATYLESIRRNVQRDESDLHDYQRTLIDFLLHHPRSFAFVDMGLGKTVSALTLLSRLAPDGFRKALVVGPIRVILQTWPDELRTWRHTAGLPFAFIRADDSDPEVRAVPAAKRPAVKERLRQKGFADPAPIHFINREALTWLAQRYRKRSPYDVLILDEATSFGAHDSTRFKAAAVLAAQAERVHLLTATPVADSYMKLFSMTYLADRGERFGKGITRFRERYFTQNPYSRAWSLREDADRIIMAEKLGDISVVMRARDYLPMDEPTFITRHIDLSPKEREQYRTLERDSVLEIGDTTVEAETAAALAMKLAQAASGAIYDEEGNTHALHDHKIEELRELAEESSAPLLVAYWFKSSRERLQKAFPKARVLGRQGAEVAPWNAGRIKMLLAHPQSAGHGLNLQKGPGHTVVFFDQPRSYELYDQFIKRIARQGQRNPVLVYNLSVRGTIDELIAARHIEKRDAQEIFFKHVAKVQARIRKNVDG